LTPRGYVVFRNGKRLKTGTDMKRMSALFALFGFGAAGAHAGIIEETQFGVTRHNICVDDCDNAGKEDGPNVHAQVTFKSPEFLAAVFKPRPYVAVSANTAGKTSAVSAGLEWNLKVTDHWSIRPGFGYAVHDGEVDSPFPIGDPRGAKLGRENVLLGSRDLFRSSLAIGRNLGDQWGAEVIYEHYSTGEILGEERNQGLDNFGVRLRYRFGN
jgi:lipid A 3-O-deacylase